MPIEVLHWGIGNFASFFAKIVEIIFKKFLRTPKLTQLSLKHICMLPELDAFKVLFYAESVDVATSGHVTKMAVTPCDPQVPKTPCYTQTSRLLSFIEPELLPIEVLHGQNREFRVFLRKIVEIIKIFGSHPKKDVAVAETHFPTHYDRSSLYVTGVTRIQSVVLRRIGGRGHFRSRNKDGGHTIRSAMADNPILYANFTTLSLTEPCYCRLKFYMA